MHRVMGTDTYNMVFTLSVCLATLTLSQCMANVIFKTFTQGCRIPRVMQVSKIATFLIL